MRHALVLLVLVLGISSLPLSAQAQWQPDGVPLCTAVNNQQRPKAVSDGAGGAITTWNDLRSGPSDVYVRRVDASGVPQWKADGVALCTAADEQYPSGIVSDGAGGAIVAWGDHRGGTDWDVYVQRVNASGIPQWTIDGVALCTAVDNQLGVTLVADGAGGAIVAWDDSRSGVSHIYAQRVNASGVPQWTADGVALCTAVIGQLNPTIASDGAGGAIVTWGDFRNGDSDIYAQWVNASGVPQWTADGIALCTATDYQTSPTIVSDTAGGAIVTWDDARNGSNWDIYTQHVNISGTPQWAADGVAVSTAANDQNAQTTVSDGTGGAIVAWRDYRNGGSDVYAQRVNPSGVPQWTANGVALCTAAKDQIARGIVADGAGGAIVTWEDCRVDCFASDIYAQRVNATGIPQWTVDGAAVCTAADIQTTPTIASDGAAGAIVVWYDRRSETSYDIYAQHVTGPVNAVAIASFNASQANGVVTLRSTFRSDLGVEAVNVYRAAGTDDNPLVVLERVNGVRGDRFEYVDRDVAPGQSYRYRIGVVDGDGEFFSPIVTVSVSTITTALSQNQPNPFNPTTTIRFVLPTREQVTLAIYDTSGHLVRTLVNEFQAYGAHEVTWDGRDDNGAPMGSGVYFYRLRAGKITESKKMVLLK